MEVTLSTDNNVRRSTNTLRTTGCKHNELEVSVGHAIPKREDELKEIMLRDGTVYNYVVRQPNWHYYYPTRIELLGGRFINITNRKLCLMLETLSCQIIQIYIKLDIDDDGNVSPTNAVVRHEHEDNTITNIGVVYPHRANGHPGYSVKIGELDISNGYTDVKFSLDNEKIGPWWVDLKFYI